jgi:hypothetical protein
MPRIAPGNETGKEAILLAYLQAHRGDVVPYNKLCRMLGYKSAGPMSVISFANT